MMRRQSGFAYIAAVVLLVVMAGIAVALLRLTDTQQTTVNQALLGARAGLTARAGIEWAFADLPARCDGLARTRDDFSYASGFRVTVTCSFQTYGEGDDPDAPAQSLLKRIYRIEAVACNGAGSSCPDQTKASVSRADYVERALVASACTLEKNRTPCQQ